MNIQLTQDEISELVRCALNKGQFIIPTGRQRLPALELVRRGLLMSCLDSVVSLPYFRTLKDGVILWITDEGRAAILALNPAELAASWPLLKDVEAAQKRLQKKGQSL